MLRNVMLAVSPVLLAVLAATPVAQPGDPAGLAEHLARVDARWTERDDPVRLAAAREALDRAAALAPDDYGVLWREARFASWLSDDAALDRRERSRIGKRGWEFAERAVEKQPGRVEGHLFAALDMGNYALSLGILAALREGIEGRFRTRLSRAEAIDPTYLGGTVYVAWGRFWYELPWPKYDARRSEEALRKALRVNVANARARVYLAELYVKEGKRGPARELLHEVIAATPGAYDPPEERRMQARARELLAKLDSKLDDATRPERP
jgi:hypothetical protein